MNDLIQWFTAGLCLALGLGIGLYIGLKLAVLGTKRQRDEMRLQNERCEERLRGSMIAHQRIASALERLLPDSAMGLQREISEWAQRTFPHQNALSKMAHLQDEVQELSQKPHDGEEMADCTILLFNLAHMHGHDLMSEVRRKLSINKARQWGKPDARGVVKHVEVQ